MLFFQGGPLGVGRGIGIAHLGKFVTAVAVEQFALPGAAAQGHLLGLAVHGYEFLADV